MVLPSKQGTLFCVRSAAARNALSEENAKRGMWKPCAFIFAFRVEPIIIAQHLSLPMGLFDKLKESFAGDDKPKTFEVTFTEQKLGMTLATGPNGEPVVTQGGLDGRTRMLYIWLLRVCFCLNDEHPSKYSFCLQTTLWNFPVASCGTARLYARLRMHRQRVV